MSAFYDATGRARPPGQRHDLHALGLRPHARSPRATGGSVGTDHGWGSHQFVMGDARRPAATSTAPRAATARSSRRSSSGGVDDTSTRTTAAAGSRRPRSDQYGATLAEWFGVVGARHGLGLPDHRQLPGDRPRLHGRPARAADFGSSDVESWPQRSGSGVPVRTRRALGSRVSLNPDVVDAIEAPAGQGRALGRSGGAAVARRRGELVSVHSELRALLYAGVLLLRQRRGPLSQGEPRAARPGRDRDDPRRSPPLACLFYAWRRSPPFSWRAPRRRRTSRPTTSCSSASCSSAADLAYLETQFRWLGAELAAATCSSSRSCTSLAAYRFDSRVVLSLALSTFAAWRGVAVSLAFAGRGVGRRRPSARMRSSAACSSSRAGILSVRCDRKAHFEPVWSTLGPAPASRRARLGRLRVPARTWLLWELRPPRLRGRRRSPSPTACGARSISRSACSPRTSAGSRDLGDMLGG